MAEYPKNKKYIKWINYGAEGWQPVGFDTLKEAIEHNSYGSEWVIDKAILIRVYEEDLPDAE